MIGSRSSTVTGTTEPRVTMIPTTRSCSRRMCRGPASGTAPNSSVLPTRRCRSCAAIWSTATSPGRSGLGRRPDSIFGISRVRPYLLSSGVATTAAPSSRPGGSSGACRRQRRYRRHARQPGQGIVVTAGPVVGGRDECVRRLKHIEEPGVRAVGPPRASRGGQHHAAGQADEQHQGRPAQPAATQFAGGKAQHGAHPHHPLDGATRHGQPSRCTPRPARALPGRRRVCPAPPLAAPWAAWGILGASP